MPSMLEIARILGEPARYAKEQYDNFNPIDIDERTPEYYKYGGGGVYGVDEPKTSILSGEHVSPEVHQTHMENRATNPVATKGFIDRSPDAQENEATRQQILSFMSEVMGQSPEDEQYEKFLQQLFDSLKSNPAGSFDTPAGYGRHIYEDEFQ